MMYREAERDVFKRLAQVTSHDLRNLFDIDRLGDIAVETFGQQAFAVAFHGGGSKRDDRNVLGLCIRLRAFAASRPFICGN